MAAKYTAKDIEVLEGLEPVRARPGMFIAGTDTAAGLHQLVFELLDNSVDEAMNGYASEIKVILYKDLESVSVEDDGRGIPVEKHPKYKISALELILTTLHAGGKFSDKNYKTAGGLHGVGSSVVNALSKELVATVKRGGKEYQQTFAKGKPKTKMKLVKKSARGSGTKIFFRPDGEIFSKTEFSAKTIRETLKTKAYLNPGLKLIFTNESKGETEEFLYDEGLSAYLTQLVEERKCKVIGEPFAINRVNGAEVNLAFVWTQSPKEDFFSYVNGIHTTDGGSHENGAKTGLVKAVRNYINVHELEAKGVKISAEDIREGLICLVSVKLPSSEYQAQFQGQTKGRLNNPEVAPIVEGVAKSLEQLLNEKPTTAGAIVDRVMLASKARAASRAAAQSVTRKLGISHRLTLPGKLADCGSIRQDRTELFIVEGDSAGGSTKQGRDRHFQAVLPLRGKVLNAIAAPTKKVLENKELFNVISALGCGVGDRIKLEKLRYSKIIILTDADADGMHISTLLLAFFFKHLTPLIEEGRLYLGKPPLYGIFPKGVAQSGGAKDKEDKAKEAAGKKGTAKKGAKKQSGKKKMNSALWAYSDEELGKITSSSGLKSPRIVRYKGLGEMNPKTLWETTLDPESRTLLRVSMEGETEVEQHFQALLGSDSSTRYNLIQSYASELEVDI